MSNSELVTPEQAIAALAGLLISKNIITNEEWSKVLDLAFEIIKDK